MDLQQLGTVQVDVDKSKVSIGCRRLQHMAYMGEKGCMLTFSPIVTIDNILVVTKTRVMLRMGLFNFTFYCLLTNGLM